MAQMATLLHHIPPWMTKSIFQAEYRTKIWVSKQDEHRIQGVHKFLDAFVLLVLAQPSPTTDLIDIWIELDSQRADFDSILEMRDIAPETPPSELADDSVLNALFNVHAEPPTE